MKETQGRSQNEWDRGMNGIIAKERYKKERERKTIEDGEGEKTTETELQGQTERDAIILNVKTKYNYRSAFCMCPDGVSILITFLLRFSNAQNQLYTILYETTLLQSYTKYFS